MRRTCQGIVMSIFPNWHGFAYVVFEGGALLDWGMSDVRRPGKNRVCLERISRLLDRYEPDVLVLRDTSNLIIPRDRRLRALIEAIQELAAAKPLKTVHVSRGQIQDAFDRLETPTRAAIIQTIAERIPSFEWFVPPIRKIWESEDRRMGLFDAAALALTFLQSQSVEPTDPT